MDHTVTPGAEHERSALPLLLDEAVVRALVEDAPDGIVMTDEDGRIVLVNRQTERLFGYSRDELLGAEVEILIPEAARGPHTAHRLRYRAAPRARPMGIGMELSGRRADGAVFPVEVSLSPISSGRGRYFLAIVRDVSARKAADAERDRLQQLLDAGHEAIFVIDPTTLGFAYVNQGAAELTGYRREQLAEMTPAHLTPHLDADAHRDMLDGLLERGIDRLEFQTVVRRADGTDVDCDVLMQVVEAGDERWGVAFVRDVTERVRAEAALREAEREMAMLTDRERIARDLHDLVIQRLFATGMSLQAVVPLAPPPAAERIQQAIDDLDGTIRDIRRAIFELQAHRLAGGSARQAVMEVVDELAPSLGFAPHVSFAGPVDALVTGEVAEHLLAALREMLANVARHAGASRASVDLTVGDDIVLRVVDDGRGIGETTRRSGLANLAERASALGGRFTVGPGPQGGTAATWRVPIPR
jgi:PAS domain S-box-containing protein